MRTIVGRNSLSSYAYCVSIAHEESSKESGWLPTALEGGALRPQSPKCDVQQKKMKINKPASFFTTLSPSVAFLISVKLQILEEFKSKCFGWIFMLHFI